MRVKVHGSRGSIAISRPHSRYGGNTSCIELVTEVSGAPESLFIDAGSGLLQAKIPSFPVNLLISHLHLDHIAALAMLPAALNPALGVNIYTASRDERPLKEQVCGVFVPPYWPKALAKSRAIHCIPLVSGEAIQAGSFTVTPFYLNIHPDMAICFHITDGNKTLVHLLDGETPRISPDEAVLLASYCKGADMVIFDAAYTCEDYQTRVGWGHSTVADGVALAREWGCAHMLFAHFDQKYTDDELDTWCAQWEGVNTTKFSMAYDGMEVTV